MAIAYALATGFAVYFAIVKTLGFRLEQEEEFRGSDLTIHQINAYPEDAVTR